jgi:hypothetical protein
MMSCLMDTEHMEAAEYMEGKEVEPEAIELDSPTALIMSVGLNLD